MPPKLYQYEVCPFCCKVKAILAYKRIPYEKVEVHPLNKKEIGFSKDYKKVPIFITDSGEQINDSTPIMRFIDENYPAKPVFEREDAARSREQEWLGWSEKILVRALPPLIYRSLGEARQAFDYITQVGKFNRLQQSFIKYSGAFVMKMVAKKSAKEQKIDDPEAHFKQTLRTWADALEERHFLGGSKPNGADLAVYGILSSIRELPSFRFVEQNPKVIAWYDNVESSFSLAA